MMFVRKMKRSKRHNIPDIIAVIVNISLLQLNSGLEISSFDSYGIN